MRRKILACAALLTSVGCYASHERASEERPLAGSRLEIELSDDEYLALCEWFVRHQPGGWPDEPLYSCLDGGAVGRRLTPENCLARRHSRASIAGCRFRVDDWYACGDHYVGAGLCGDAPSVCRRPDECMDGTGRWRYLHP